MGRLKGFIISFFSVLAHLVAALVIFYFWQPIASWYFNYRPILGVDFYNLASYVGYLSRHFVFRVSGWKYTWWGGGPLFLDYPTLHAYLVLPLLKWFSLIQAIQLYVLGSLFLFLFFAYLLFVEIGKDRVLAIVLTIASSFSIGVYGGLVWAGGLQYFATQPFLPLVLWFLIKYFKSNNKRFFYLSSLFLGISFLAHPLVGFSYTIPIAFLLLLAYPLKGEKFFSLGRVKRIISFFGVAILAGYPAMYLYLGRSPLEILLVLPRTLLRFLQPFLQPGEATRGFVSSEGGALSPIPFEIVQYQRNQLQRLFTDANDFFFPMLLVMAVVFLLTFLIRKKRLNSLKVIIFALPVIWVIFYNALYAFGISLFHGGWYRAFWPFPIALGILASFIWGDFWEEVKERLGEVGKKAIFSFLIPIVSGVLMIGPGFFLLSQNSAQKMITEIETPGYRQQSSAFPDSLGVYIEKNEFEDLKKRLVPTWLDPNETNYRFYDADQRVNIWWNGLYDMPLVKGYVELPPGDAFSGAFYWTSIALTGQEDSLVKSWGLSEQMAYNNTLFLIDWFSIKYLEAEHEKSDSYNPLTSYLAKSDIFENRQKVVIPGWVQLYMVPAGQPLIWHPEEDEHLTYYQVRDELVSPIIHPTNAPVLGFIGKHATYYTLLRSLAAANLNSRRVVPVRLGEFIDDVSYQDLKNVDAVILDDYDYKNHGKVWARLEEYVSQGGKVFVETGSDVKQTNSSNLPAKYPKELPSIFPINMTKQAKIGKTWRLIGDSKESLGINLEAFGPPIIDDEPWLFSLPASPTDLRQGARVVLSANGLPLIVSWKYGKGEVIWSGVNLPYHIITHKNLAEAKFFQNLLANFVSTSAVSYGEFTAQRQSPNKVILKSSNAKGVFFRENLNPGWTAKLTASGKSQNLKIYPAGPTYFGFSYVRLPEGTGGSFTVTFSYRGEFWVYFWQVVSFLTILLTFDYVLFGSRFLVPLLKKLAIPAQKRVGGWWEKEEY